MRILKKLFTRKKYRYYNHEQSTTIVLIDELLDNKKITDCEYDKIFTIIDRLNKYEYIKK